MPITLNQLIHTMEQAPVMGRFHPLVPLCLPPNVQVITDPLTAVEQLDSLEAHAESPIIIPHFEARYSHRFLLRDYPDCPPAAVINQALPHRFTEARQWLLTQHDIATRIVEDVRAKHYQTVILLLVDGLSYEDVRHWPEAVEPCLIDGPSITFSRTPNGEIDPRVGFPSIIGSPPLARRLSQIGLTRARGYSYWERAQNDVSAVLFAGMPLKKMPHIDAAIEQMFALNLKGMYIQLVQEGLDGLAHSRREVHPLEIQAVVNKIQANLHRLRDALREQSLHGAIYVTADHGILWKTQHNWLTIPEADQQHPRYSSHLTQLADCTTIQTAAQRFQLCHYPYLNRQIKANDSGVHGGLSYQESIVPFVKLEVTP